MEKHKVAVVIPFYKNTLTHLEKIALKQCFNILSKHPIICTKPNSLDLEEVNGTYNFSETIAFNDFYFQDVQGYNRLMLSPEFYKAFLKYEFILIYQLDAFAFKDDLIYWCNQKFDYIGAPWLRHFKYPDLIKKLKSLVQNIYHTRFNTKTNGIPTDIQFENKVGNGGFSLRRVSKFYDLTIRYKNTIDYYNSQIHHYFHEDAFWSIEVNRIYKNLNIPNYKIALKFSFENLPQRCLKLTKGELPFGCHAWDNHKDFWKPYFKDLNFDI